MNRLHRFAVCAGVATMLAAATPSFAQKIDAKEYWLDNGMQVLMVERHEAPTIMASIFARVGSSNETTGITGISHLFEHMMFKGTHVLGTRDIGRDLEIIEELDGLRVELQREDEKLQVRHRPEEEPPPIVAPATPAVRGEDTLAKWMNRALDSPNRPPGRVGYEHASTATGERE